jgi:hypothetical protein
LAQSSVFFGGKSGRFALWFLGLLAFLLCLISLLALAKCFSPRPSVTVVISDYGIYDAIVETTGDWSRGIPVAITGVGGIVHDETTSEIPMRDEIYWGYRATIANQGDKPVTVFSIARHPPVTSPDGKTTTEDRSRPQILHPHESMKACNLRFFMDRCRFEFVPGEWTLEFSVDGQVASSKTFTVYQP